ncbi:NATD1 [Cervus elaphus hippelaphus]|uniref:Protein NATD1 n=1 Tax=Cervus elaphus hippelaphus TaxID=46360 RepID=A0A212D8J4_CEREH|nr:NATD1 [Cervus elaphus hippelaphus]
MLPMGPHPVGWCSLNGGCPALLLVSPLRSSVGQVVALGLHSLCTWCDVFESERCHDRAVLLYEYVGKRIVDLQHTEVPDAYRGRGIAKHLAKAALDFVVEEDLRAHVTCWYIQKFVKENPLPQYLERLQP